MKVTKKIILIGTSFLLAGVAAIWLLLENYPKQKSTSIKPVLMSKEKAVKSTTKFDEDKYYRDHPYVRKAEAMNDASSYDSAIYYYKEAAANFKKDKELHGYVWATNYVSRLYLFVKKQNYLNALPFLKSALTKEKVIGTNHPFVATTYFYWGLYYYKERQTAQALKMYQKSLAIRIKNYGEQHLEVAEIYKGLGDVYFYLQFNGKVAEQYYVKSLRMKEALAGKTDPSLIYNYYSLLNLNVLIGDYAEAESFGYEAMQNLKYVENNKIYWEEFLEGVMASIYVEQKKFKKAVPKLNSAITLNLKNDGDKGYLALYYNSLGEIYSKSSKHDSAIVYFNKALKLTANDAGDTDYNLGTTYFELKRYNIALRYLKRCLYTRLKIYGDKHIETAVAFQNISNVYQHAGLLDSSGVYLQKALLACTKNFNNQDFLAVPLVSNINNNYNSFQILKDKALILKKLYIKNPTNSNLLNTSLKYYCLTDTLLTNFQSEYDRESSKLNYLRNSNNIYEEAIDCATLLYNQDKNITYLDYVFQFIDKRKSSLLLGALYEKDKFKELNIPTKEYQVQLELQKDLIFLQSLLEETTEEETFRLKRFPNSREC